MMTKIKLVARIGIALAAALVAGWIWGATGRSAMARRLQTSELRDELLGARGAVLDARVAIYAVNFGEASRHLEAARTAVRSASARLDEIGRHDDSKHLTLALTRIDQAQVMAGKLNQDANALAADAARTINEVLGGTATR